jgi:hypothetical protein
MPYISSRWPWISRVVMPRAYIEMILSSKPVQRVCPLATAEPPPTTFGLTNLGLSVLCCQSNELRPHGSLLLLPRIANAQQFSRFRLGSGSMHGFRTYRQ